MDEEQARSETDRRRILIVDDHPVMRVGLKTLIDREPDLQVVGEAGGFEQAKRMVRELEPDVAVIDLSLPDGSGLELIRRLRGKHPDIRLLVCSMYDETLYAGRVLKAGAAGYISKNNASEHVIEAIRRVLADEIYLSTAMTQHMLHGARGVTPTTADDLTDRELEVFVLTGKGVKTSEIAERLHISKKTVDSHRENIKRKLNLSSSAELMRHSVQWVLEHG